MATGTPPRLAGSSSVSPEAILGDGVTVWDLSQIREGAVVGSGTIVGRNVYIDRDVRIGERCKIQNNALIYWPADIADGVFIGPGAILTNDRHPRAVTPDGALKGSDDWAAAGIRIGKGAAIGAGAILLPGITVGEWALVAAGSVVVRDVSPHSLVAGNPASHVGWVGKAGQRLIAQGAVLVDRETGDRYLEVGNALEKAQ